MPALVYCMNFIFKHRREDIECSIQIREQTLTAEAEVSESRRPYCLPPGTDSCYIRRIAPKITTPMKIPMKRVVSDGGDLP